GLHDMLGNLWEWGQDCWNESYSGAPTDGSAWTSGDCSRRVLRGGSWSYGPRDVRSANRFRVRSAIRSNNVGFRISRTHP
ncbi:MAG TPA: SUMF1/EgtB/PvdO family nonheme iron enzyme, partial [Dehalococcoidia bacterium]|nr:SUMF1/EgtB/PvdO family nonheme iron enzyme [Dehalococcoidia bacterium]